MKVLQGETPTERAGFAGNRLAKLPAIPTSSSGIDYHTKARREAQKKSLLGFTNLLTMFSLQNLSFLSIQMVLGHFSLPKPNRESRGKKNVILITRWRGAE